MLVLKCMASFKIQCPYYSMCNDHFIEDIPTSRVSYKTCVRSLFTQVVMS